MPQQNLSQPQPSLSVFDAVCILIGVVVGVGIFKAPAVVAAHAATATDFLLFWLAGALISLIGALCYAELAATWPNVGGEYHFLTRAYGRTSGFLFAWGRLSVIQTGAIATVAFVLGDYLSAWWPLGVHGPAIYAALAIGALTALNLSSLTRSKWLQNGLTATMITALVALVLTGLMAARAPLPAASGDGSHDFGLAMIFVLLTFGGWNEAAYLAAEVRDVGRNMVRILVIGIAVVTAVYLLLNLAYLNVLGLEGLRAAAAPATELLRRSVGDRAASFISAVITVAATTTLNATIMTGARSGYAFGRDFPLFRRLGRWDGHAMTPAGALLFQGTVALLLVGLGAVTRQGFVTMVEYTAPVFWLFFLMVAGSLFIFRRREPQTLRPFSVPFYPLTPALFCAACAYMLHASVVYTGIGALFGVGVLLAGWPLRVWSRRLERRKTVAGD